MLPEPSELKNDSPSCCWLLVAAAAASPAFTTLSLQPAIQSPLPFAPALILNVLGIGAPLYFVLRQGVLVTVVARPTAERFLVDGGTKTFSADGGDGPPFPGRGVVVDRPDLVIDFMNEEHGVGRLLTDALWTLDRPLSVANAAAGVGVSLLRAAAD